MQNDRSDSKHKGGRASKKSRFNIALILLIVSIVLVTGAGLGFVAASLHTLPSLKGDIRPPAASQFYDTNGKLIATTRSVENRIPVSINKVPMDLQHAFVAVEDARFYQHAGIDPRGILRAVWSNLMDRGVSEGGSTITQQLAKNALLSQERTLKRKIQEAFLALQIERQYTKNEILELYLNQIYFGQGAYGVQSASQVYFGKNVDELTLSECAMLAGIPKSPNYYSPFNNLKAATERQHTVLDQMFKYEYIDQSTANKTKNTKIKLASRSGSGDTYSSIAPYFIDYVTQQIIEKYGADTVYKDGLKIYTTLDADMQVAAEQAMNRLPSPQTDSNGVKQPQGALVAIDPHNGYIKAMVGGRGDDEFNRAVLAERQPGSAFKPFVYLAAIESGMDSASIVSDTAVKFGDWSPRNYDGKFRGKVTLRTALENSLNVPTVKLANQVGVDKPLYYAQQLGISTLVLEGRTNDRNLAAALGGLTRGVTPLEIASAFGVIANQGVKAEPIAIVKILDRNGKTLEQTTPKERAVISERSAYILLDMMRGVITNGTGAAANIGRPAAGKTGTTDDYKDAWFVGFTPNIVASVWIGHDNEGYLNGTTGGGLPASIWRSFMVSASSKYPSRDFIKPSGLSIPEPPIIDDKDDKDDKTDKTTMDPKSNTKTTDNKDNKKKDSDAKSVESNSSDKTLPPPPKPDKPQIPPPPVKNQ
ncbi:Penicillin-binding protein 1F [bioreactor metagenome]|uniref:peptidoglycan glycosyltransferase n=1 Tax=bioreactor metagenome TaxID=1076179 RepID=A0A644VKV2_9ZZZZ